MNIQPHDYIAILVWRGESFTKKTFGLVQNTTKTVKHIALQTDKHALNAHLSPILAHIKRSNGYHMSFFPQSCTTMLCTRQGAHFHSEIEDERILSNYSLRKYQLCSNCTLDVQKITEAFELFVLNPDGWNSLGGGILHRSYERSGAGMAAYLLDHGKIFQRVERPINSTFAMLSTGILSNLILMIVDFFSAYRLGNELTAIRSKMGTLEYQKQFADGKSQVLLLINKLEGSLSLSLSPVVDILKKISKSSLFCKDSELQEVDEALHMLKQYKNFMVLSLILGIAIFIFTQRRSRQKLTSEEVAGLIQMAQYNEKNNYKPSQKRMEQIIHIVFIIFPILNKFEVFSKRLAKVSRIPGIYIQYAMSVLVNF